MDELAGDYGFVLFWYQQLIRIAVKETVVGAGKKLSLFSPSQTSSLILTTG